MILIVNVDAVRFSRNGQLFDKRFRARAVSNNQVVLQDIGTGRDAWKPSHFNQIDIDGQVYGTQLETINALMEVIYSGVGGAVTISDSLGNPNGSQYPLSTNGDSVYCKDVDVERSELNDFSGTPCDLFDDLHTIIKNTTSNDPKEIFIHFKRSVVTQALGIGNASAAEHPDAPNFSNVRITAVNSGGVEILLVDQSTDDTKHTSRTYTFVPVGMNAIKVEFCTVDPVGITNFSIQKTIITASRIITSVKNPADRISEYLMNGAIQNMNVDGSVTPVDFIYEVGGDQTELFNRLIFSLVDGLTEFSSGNFGALSALTSGVEMIIEVAGVEYIQEIWQTNMDISETCYDFTNPYKDGAYVGRWTFSRDTNSPVFLPAGSKFIARVNDDLTGLDLFQMRLKGEKV
jgi:hypothetical protein